MTLTLHNTLTRRREPLEPVRPGHVGMYVCGPTVYDLAHIGNARPIVVFDVLYRVLKRLYPQVTYVRNITDIDDKINEASRKSGEPIESITARTTKAFHEDIAALGALPPDVEPRATAYVPQMIALIEALIEAGNAYEAEGHVLFHVPSAPRYGALSGRNRDEMIAGARVEVAPYKRDPADFVLWKPSDETLPGWESSWGRGRPGWHIECSAMSRAYLGETLDIHGGGMDLIFPHHENEIAQSECACPGAPFARHWVHNGVLTVEGEKMSKSLGNFVTIRDALAETPGEVIRLVLLSTHYRHPLDWTADGISPRPALNLDKPLHRAAQRGRRGWGGRRQRRPRGRGRALRRSQHAEGARRAPQAHGRPQPGRRRGGQGTGLRRAAWLRRPARAVAGRPRGVVPRCGAGRRHERCRNPGADRSPCHRAVPTRLRRGRPHPRGDGGRGHRPRRHGGGHAVAPCAMNGVRRSRAIAG